MWPWGHAAVGFLVLLAIVLARRRELPSRGETLVVLVAATLPDLIDKPLGWWLGVLPTGRSLGHSVITAVILVVAVAMVARRIQRPDVGIAFAVGYLTHLPGDVPLAVLHGEVYWASFLVWPLVPPPDWESEPSVTAHVVAIEPTPWFVLQGLAALVVLVLTVISLRADTGRGST